MGFEEDQKARDRLLKRCKECGYRRRGPGHEEGEHHRHAPLKAHGYGEGKKGGKLDKIVRHEGPKRPPLTIAKKEHPGYDFRQIKVGGRR